MTLQALKEKYAGMIQRLSAEQLKGNPVFMKACRENEEFKLWVLDRKPTMATVKVPTVKFLGLSHSKVPTADKTPQIASEPVEKLSKTEKITKDLKGYIDRKGFL